MHDRKLISRFDPLRKENLIKKKLSRKDSGNYKDFTRLNIYAGKNKDTAMSFKKIFDQNLPKLVSETNLSRQDIINIYTRFVSIFMLQQSDPKK